MNKPQFIIVFSGPTPTIQVACPFSFAHCFRGAWYGWTDIRRGSSNRSPCLSCIRLYEALPAFLDDVEFSDWFQRIGTNANSAALYGVFADWIDENLFRLPCAPQMADVFRRMHRSLAALVNVTGATP